MAADPYRLALVERLELGELVDVLLDEVGHLPQQPRPLRRHHVAPGSGLEGAPRRRDCAIDVDRIAGRHLPQHCAGGGVQSLERAAGSGFDPAAVDEHPPRSLRQEAPGARVLRFDRCDVQRHGQPPPGGMWVAWFARYQLAISSRVANQTPSSDCA